MGIARWERMSLRKNASRHRIGAAIVLCAGLALAGSPAGAQDPAFDTSEIVRTAHMSALLEKTFIGVDVLRVEIDFGRETASALRDLADRGAFTDELAEQIAARAFRADHAFVRVRFQRDVTLDQFVEGVRENLRHAYDAGMINGEMYQNTSRRLPQWFGFLRERGFREGDQLLYRAHPHRLRTVMLDAEGNEMLDQTDLGVMPRLTLLSGYFAPGTDLREPLIRSLLAD
jgi:hypothetical protein